jgi:integrase
MVMALNTNITYKNARPKEKDYKISEGGGLYMIVGKDGSKRWRMDYRFDDKRKTLAIGVYPLITLAEARKQRDEAKLQLANGIDPVQHKKNQRLARQEKAEADSNTFEKVAREWHSRFTPTWSGSYAEKVLSRLQQYVFPHIGARPIAEISTLEYLSVLRKAESRVLETAHRIRILCGQVVRYAIQTGRAQHDPITALRGALPPAKEKHFPALTEPADVAAMLRAIWQHKKSQPHIHIALKLLSYVFTRPGELRVARWSDIDFEACEWRFFVTKTKQQHIVPLSCQVIGLLRELQSYTANSEFLFPGERSKDRAISDGTLNMALVSAGISKEQHVPHGFRATARTLLDEQLGVPEALIEHQLAHRVQDALGRAYNRTKHLAARHEMMQRYADYLDQLREGAQIIPFPAKTA